MKNSVSLVTCTLLVYFSLLIIIHVASEVSEMNHEATKLSEHLSALRKESEHVVGLLTQMKAESTAKRDKEEQDKFENIKLLNNSTHRIQRELDVSSAPILKV